MINHLSLIRPTGCAVQQGVQLTPMTGMAIGSVRSAATGSIAFSSIRKLGNYSMSLRAVALGRITSISVATKLQR